MTIATQLIQKELQRNEKMTTEYQRELDNLPKGTLNVKKINSHRYYYLKFREGGKVVTKYVGTGDFDVSNLIKQLEKRKHIEEMIKELKSERRELEKLGSMI